VFRGAVDGATIWWVAPTYKVGRKIWRDLRKACRFAAVDKSEVEQRIELPGGGSVTVQSADNPDVLVGEGLDGVVIDETGITDERLWKESIRPALSDKLGWAIFIGTPHGRNWYHKLFEYAGTEANWERWQRPTSDNPLIPLEELEAAKRDIGPRAYAQQYDAQFMDMEGALFPGHYFPESIWFDHWPENVAWKTIAVDPSLGKTDRSDYSAIVSLALDSDGVMWVDASLERRPPAQIVRDVLTLAGTFQPHSVAVEANQFQTVLASQLMEASKRAGMMLPVQPVIQTVKKEIRIAGTLDRYLAYGELRFRRTLGGQMLVSQLQEFPEGEHDDGPDALELAVGEMKRLFYTGVQSGRVDRVMA
jgi:predicted phage terminase large subunit-like protein